MPHATPKHRADFIDALLAGNYDGTTAARTLGPSEARYALWLGFALVAQWSPYPGRTVTRSVSSIQNTSATTITLVCHGDNAHPVTIQRDTLQIWADRNQQHAAERARAIPAPGQRGAAR